MIKKETYELIEKLTHIDKKTLVEKTLKLGEEYGELSEAILALNGTHGCTYKIKDKNISISDIVSETADIMIVALSILHKATDDFKSTFEEKYGKDFDIHIVLDNYIKTKLYKWESKLHYTDSQLGSIILLELADRIELEYKPFKETMTIEQLASYINIRIQEIKQYKDCNIFYNIKDDNSVEFEFKDLASDEHIMYSITFKKENK